MFEWIRGPKILKQTEGHTAEFAWVTGALNRLRMNIQNVTPTLNPSVKDRLHTSISHKTLALESWLGSRDSDGNAHESLRQQVKTTIQEARKALRVLEKQ